MVHEDERRTLEAYPEGKMITANSDCVVGQHYHKIKTEVFIFVRGECRMIKRRTTGVEVEYNYNLHHGAIETVRPGEYHEFHLKKGSILIGLCSHPYDSTDDYKIW